MKVIERLYELQELEFSSDAGSAAAKSAIEVIRKETPETVLGHYDRLVVRGKKAVVFVRHGVCTGCRMKLPSGSYAALMRDSDVAMCENCGRYLLLAPEDYPASMKPPTAPPAPPIERGAESGKATPARAKRKKAVAKPAVSAKS